MSRRSLQTDLVLREPVRGSFMRSPNCQSFDEVNYRQVLSKLIHAWLADPKSGYKREHFAYLRKTAQTHLRRIQIDW